MSLPFADKPEQSRIYQDLKTLALSEITDLQFDSFLDQLSAQGVAGLEDEYRRLALLQFVTGKFTAPGLTGETDLVEVIDTSGTGSFETLFRPNEGETWLLNAASLGVFNAGLCILYVSDGGTKDMIIGSESAGGAPFNPPPQGPIYVTYDHFLKYETQAVTGNCTIYAYLARIR
jgi:hypothetical protein